MAVIVSTYPIVRWNFKFIYHLACRKEKNVCVGTCPDEKDVRRESTMLTLIELLLIIIAVTVISYLVLC